MELVKLTHENIEKNTSAVQSPITRKSRLCPKRTG